MLHRLQGGRWCGQGQGHGYFGHLESEPCIRGMDRFPCGHTPRPEKCRSDGWLPSRLSGLRRSRDVSPTLPMTSTMPTKTPLMPSRNQVGAGTHESLSQSVISGKV